MISIDGAQGGGQLLRTALSLSAILREPFEITNIRGAREIGGLKAQHLKCVHAMQKICKANVQGDFLGSIELKFEPQAPAAGGNYSFDIGTAGSTTLLAQCILPALIFCGQKSKVEISGGTHVAWSPSAHYLRDVFLPALARMNMQAEIRLEKFGFYPQGGGKILLDVQPCKKIQSIQVQERGKLVSLNGVSLVAGGLPMQIAERQKTAMLKTLAGSGISFPCEPKIKLEEARATGKGTFAFLVAEYENVFAGFGSLGELGKPAELVGGECAQKFLEFHSSVRTVDGHLSDQLMIYAALAEGTSNYACEITPHVLTNAGVLKLFLEKRGLAMKITGKEGAIGVVEISGAAVDFD